MNKEINRIAWKCRRGMREIDLLLREFSKEHLSNLDIENINEGTATAIQIHRAGKHERTTRVGKYSAGCIVIQTGFQDFMDTVKKQKQFLHSDIFSLTVLKGIYL